MDSVSTEVACASDKAGKSLQIKANKIISEELRNLLELEILLLGCLGDLFSVFWISRFCSHAGKLTT